MAADILNSRGNTLGLKGSKGSTYEGGIRVPAIIYYKGVLEKSLSSFIGLSVELFDFEKYI